jgi:hypothetical protein
MVAVIWVSIIGGGSCQSARRGVSLLAKSLGYILRLSIVWLKNRESDSEDIDGRCGSRLATVMRDARCKMQDEEVLYPYQDPGLRLRLSHSTRARHLDRFSRFLSGQM